MDKNYISFIGRIAAFFSGGKASGKRAGAALFTLASALGLWLFVAAHFRADAITEAGRSLATINSYKAAQISSWLGYHEREALRLSRHPFLGELVMQELAGPGSRRAQLTSWLIDHARQKRYSSMAFLSPKGAVIVTSPGHPAVGGKEFTAGFEQAVQKKRGLVTDLYLAAAGKPRLTIFSPIFQNGDGKKPVCVLAINIDPGAEFYPLVKAAPLFFVNAETLLVRKEGDSVLFLNELEYAKDAALRLKRPLSDKKLPAAAALAGQTGFFEGVDYRGVEVFSAIGPVKGTAWAVVTKIDRAALLAPVRRTQYLWLAVLLLAAGLLHAGLLAVFAAKRRAAEALLAHSRNLLAETERLGKVGGWELDLATGKNIWTDEVYRIHEVDPSYDPNVEKAINFYAPSSRPAIERAVRRAIERGDGFDLELEIITAKGNVRAVHAIGRADLKAQRLYGFFQDITERKRAEEQLHESESKYSRLYQQMMDSFVRVDMDGRILEFNEAYCRLTGYTPEELKNLTYQDLTPAAWHEAERAILQDKIIARGYSGLYEKEYRRKDGSLVPVELSTTLERDAGGKPRAMCGVIRDISERKRAEEKLRVEQERFRQAAEAAQFGVYSYDHETGESSYSDEFMWLYGLPAGATLELDADLAPKALHPADKAGFLTAMKAGNDPAGSGVFEHEFRIILPDSRARWLRVRGRTFFSGTGAGARPLRASGIIQDVSERKEIAEILRESEARLRSLWLHMDEGVALHELVRGSSGEPENYRIIEVNPRYGTILGILPDEIKNQLATEAYKTPVPPYLKEYSAVVASGKPAYLETYFPPMDKHFSISIAPWGRDGFATIFSDITDKKRADEALLKSTRSLSDAQKLAHLGYWDWDVRTGAVKWSEEVYKIFGLDP
ncbi:MAG TPA: hypothetical protein DCZ92_12875, partial [Elusimicrobia bacterium]|nr:hypothetical protein [Elusimicrobiota bacterium]